MGEKNTAKVTTLRCFFSVKTKTDNAVIYGFFLSAEGTRVFYRFLFSSFGALYRQNTKTRQICRQFQVFRNSVIFDFLSYFSQRHDS